MIAACVAMKRDIVQRDEFDAGARRIWILGYLRARHRSTGDFSVGHGHAVGMGMRIITAASVKKGFCPAIEILDTLLDKYGLEKHCSYAAAQLAEGAMRDKSEPGSRSQCNRSRNLHASQHRYLRAGGLGESGA